MLRRYDSSMLANRLVTLLGNAAVGMSLSPPSHADITERFESLRGFALLPAGRQKNIQHLSLTQIIAAILSLATTKPGLAGLAAKSMMDLRPVGGFEIAFERCTHFGEALERLIESPFALKSLIEVRVSDGEIFTNGYGSRQQYHYT